MPAATTAPEEGDSLTAIIEVTPEYPANAQNQGLEGFVELSFSVSPFGIVENPVVTSSEPANVFDAAALAAVRQWRYLTDQDRAPQALSERIEFKLGDYVLSMPAPAERFAGTATARIIRTGNQCVREQVSYNYGEMIEVGLMNACPDPLVVFSCAQGTGQYRDRWVCIDSEQRQSLLVAPGDSRVGTTTIVDMPTRGQTFRYEQDLYIARAPNSQYWWLACGRDDLSCRDSGRLWLRSIDRQLAIIDPQSRTSRALARSY